MTTYLISDTEGNVKKKWLISGSDDKTIKIWDMDTRKLLDTLQSSSKKELHRNGVTCLTVFGKELYSGGQDTNTFYYDMEVVERRINEFLQMEAEDLRSRKAEAYYNYLE